MRYISGRTSLFLKKHIYIYVFLCKIKKMYIKLKNKDTGLFLKCLIYINIALMLS